MEANKDIISGFVPILKAYGLEIPEELKRRDKREPGRKEKETAENKLYRIIRRYWSNQQKEILAKVESFRFFVGKSLFDDYFPGTFWESDEELKASLARFFTEAAINGIQLFGQINKPLIDYTLANGEASKWALAYSGDLIKGINATTKEEVRKLIQAFIDNPGYTLGDIAKQLPYSEDRAIKIAVTEVTKAYAQGNKLAGEEMKRQFPKVKVVKIWNTNVDDRVCPICNPLDGKQIPENKLFPNGIELPPAHINCRCWITYTTDISE